jgi:hypothetical protein
MMDEGLIEIVGGDNVIKTSITLEEYSRDSSFAPGVRPCCIVRPCNVDQVQRIVKWANETRTCLVPVSSGPPHFHGDTVPAVDDTVIVDLTRMKRIIKVDPRNRYAIVEPGVTFNELQERLAKEGLCAYVPLAPRSSKSVIGSMLEREPVTMPAYHWDSTDPLLCAEVVFGSGDKLRTGEASGPDTIEEQWENNKTQMNPFGHSVVDFQRLLTGAQGTIGIVTWASLKCGYSSQLRRAFLAPCQTLEPLIELSSKIAKFRLGGHHFILNGLNLACLLGGTRQKVRELRNMLPPWCLFISFEGYGPLPADKVRYEEADFRAMARLCGVAPVESIPGANAEEVLHLMNRPSADPYWKTRLKGSFQDIFFLTTPEKTPGFAIAMSDLARKLNYPAEDIGVYLQVMVQGTSCHCEFDLYYDPADSAGSDIVSQFLTRGAEQMVNMGAFFSRPYWQWKDAAYRKAAGTASVQKKVKQIFDPNGILNPGKLCF